MVKREEDLVKQLVVPKLYRRTVVTSLGKFESKRLLNSTKIFCPGIYKGVRNYGDSSSDCQVLTPRLHYHSPLVPLPIKVPFWLIVKFARGHQHILVIMDYTTHYPEALILRNT